MHKAGVKHYSADTLSHFPTVEVYTTALEDNISMMAVEKTDTDAPTVHFFDAHVSETTSAITALPDTITPTPMEGGNHKQPPRGQEFLKEQPQDSFDQDTTQSVEPLHFKYKIDQHGFLVRRPMIDGSIQTVVPQALRR